MMCASPAKPQQKHLSVISTALSTNPNHSPTPATAQKMNSEPVRSSTAACVSFAESSASPPKAVWGGTASLCWWKPWPEERELSSLHPQNFCTEVSGVLFFATFQTYALISYLCCSHPCEDHTLFSRKAPNLHRGK